jgi:hypothetical protein
MISWLLFQKARQQCDILNCFLSATRIADTSLFWPDWRIEAPVAFIEGPPESMKCLGATVMCLPPDSAVSDVQHGVTQTSAPKATCVP